LLSAVLLDLICPSGGAAAPAGSALALRKRRWSMVAHDLAAGSCGLTWR